MRYKQPSVSYAPSLGRSWWHNNIVSILPDTTSGPISPKLQMRGTRSIFDIFQKFQRIYGQNRLNFKKSHWTFWFGYLCAKRASTPHPNYTTLQPYSADEGPWQVFEKLWGKVLKKFDEPFLVSPAFSTIDCRRARKTRYWCYFTMT